MSEQVIVKVQRPVVTNDPEPHVLIYQRGHFGVYEGPISDADNAVLGIGRKVFCYAEHDGDRYRLISRAPRQDW